MPGHNPCGHLLISSSLILHAIHTANRRRGMKGSAKVIQELNAALSSELTAIVQYMVQAEMHANWGYRGLSAITKKRAIEEMRHAEGLIERIIFFDSTPEVSVALQPQIGKNVKAHLETDLADELDAVKQYNA